MLDLALSIEARARMGAAAFHPATLFSGAAVGAFYDPSDLSTLWQDTAGTSPVTTAGQSVARMDDKSGNGYNLTQATAAARPSRTIQYSTQSL